MTLNEIRRLREEAEALFNEDVKRLNYPARARYQVARMRLDRALERLDSEWDAETDRVIAQQDQDGVL